MRSAIVVHGPEAVDTGLALRLIEVLKERGEVRAIMSGFTGVAAVIDAGLEHVISIERHHMPSVTLEEQDDWADILYIGNSGKNMDSAMRFGGIVYQHCHDELRHPLVQVDQEAVILWTEEGEEEARWIADRLGRPWLRGELPMEERAGWRELGGVLPGENVWVNGVVVGKATSSSPRISRDASGRIVAEGITLKPTGVERLGSYDPWKARVRSGQVRRTSVKARVPPPPDGGKVHLIDHAAEKAIYHCRQASLVVTVGDDTSRAAGSVLARFGVPIIAIVDGDEDGISLDRTLAPGSVRLLVRSGTDDLVGADVKRRVFQGRNVLDRELTIEEMVDAITEVAGDRFLKRSDG